jgi:hypothetical protein
VANFDLTKSQGVLKRIYDKRLNEVLYSVDGLKLNPGFASLKTGKGNLVKTPFGDAYAVAIQHARGGSTSADADTCETMDADGTGASPEFKQFLVTPAKLITTQVVDGDTLDRCKDEGAFIQAASFVVKNAMAAHVRKLCILSAGNGSGAIAKITAAPTSTTITVDPSQVRNIEIGDKLVAAAAESSGGLRSATYSRVTARNSVSGVITLSVDPTSLSWASGDFVFWNGVRNLAPKGYFGWAPQIAPTGGDSFFGIDRSTDPVRLGGNRFDCLSGGLGYREALIRASLAAIAEGASPTRVRVSPEDYAQICIEGEELPGFNASSTQGDTTIGFKAVMLAGVGPVVLDESMAKTHFMMEDESGWRMLSDDGNLVHIVSHDGLVFRKTTGDRWAVTLKSLVQMVSDRPGHQLHGFNFGAAS